jgi:tetratricopeptide (TPR) repeat protein
MMKEYQPWSDEWRKEITFVPWLQSDREDMQEAPVLPLYPIFVAGLEKNVEGEAFWQAVSGAMTYLLGHEPDHPLANLYVRWLSIYNPDLAERLMIDGTLAASQYDVATAIWMLQAALLLNPYLIEANYNLGLAFCQLGEALQKENCQDQAQSSYQQAYRYLSNTIELDHTLSTAYYTLGVVCRRLNKPEESKAYLEKAIVLDLAK